MNLLLASLIAPVIGPFLYRLIHPRRRFMSALDGFILVAICGLALLSILPEALANSGWLAIPFALIGLAVPTVMENVFHRAQEGAHTVALLLGMAGLGLHALADGVALVDQPGRELLPLAVVLHRLPVGLTIWWLLRPVFGVRVACAGLGLIISSTIVGYWIGPQLTTTLSGQALSYFQALVAGSLLHVVLHQPHGPGIHAEHHQVEDNKWFEGMGALLGIAFLVPLMMGHGVLSGGLGREIVTTFVRLSLESAPALLLAYVMAGLMSAFLPVSSLRWMRRGSGGVQALKGMTIGLPFPVCSCGVVPLYRTLIRGGAPPAAAMAFLVSTPELGVDAVLISIPLLGGQMTLIRILGAALVAFLVGWIVGGRVRPGPVPSEVVPMSPARSSSTVERLRAAVAVGLGEVVDHTAPWIVLGLAVAALANPLLQGGWLDSIPGGLEVPIFTLLGLPAYVCASGATPLVAILLLNGISPGAALAFLLTGPATNLTTFGVLSQMHGKRVALSFSAAMIALSAGMGYLVNAFFPDLGSVPANPLEETSASALQVLSLTLLTALFLFSILRRGARSFIGEVFLSESPIFGGHSHEHSHS